MEFRAQSSLGQRLIFLPVAAFIIFRAGMLGELARDHGSLGLAGGCLVALLAAGVAAYAGLRPLVFWRSDVTRWGAAAARFFGRH